MGVYDIVVCTEYGELNVHGIEAVSHSEAKDIAVELCRIEVINCEAISFEVCDE